MVSSDGVSSKIKVLLLDKETTSIISMCTTQSLLLKHEVYLIDRIDNPNREKMRHLKCLVFVRPTPDSIQCLIEELRHPKYAEYHLFFSNIVKKSHLERLAESDDHEIVTKVQELFADYLVVNSDLFTFNMHSPNFRIFGDQFDTWNSEALNRSVEGLSGLLLSLKMKPLIRFDKNSQMCRKLASELSYTVNQESQLFDFRKPDTPPILLLVDRRNDPITPLLTPWTYQAMVHHLLGINNNRVDLSNVPEVSKELSEIVLSSDQDAFFTKSMYLNFGDLGASIKDYVSQYQAKTKSNSSIESIADMKRFVEEYPEFRKLSGNVSKHVTLVGELSRLVGLYNLLQVSELEQSLACNDSHNSDLKQLQQLLILPTINDESKLRLVALYSLRYQHHSNNATPQLIQTLESNSSNLTTGEINALKCLINTYAGSQSRQENLFGSDSFFAKAQSGFKGLKGVENVYTQHSPLLQNTLTSLLKSRLKKSTQPFFDDGKLPAWAKNNNDTTEPERPQDIVVYMVGGVTYEEAKLVAEMNATMKGVRIILGGTNIHSSTSFLRDVEDAADRWPMAGTMNAQDRLRART